MVKIMGERKDENKKDGNNKKKEKKKHNNSQCIKWDNKEKEENENRRDRKVAIILPTIPCRFKIHNQHSACNLP